MPCSETEKFWIALAIFHNTSTITAFRTDGLISCFGSVPLQDTAIAAEFDELAGEMLEVCERMGALTGKIAGVVRRGESGKVCAICDEEPVDPQATPCGHVFCSEHLTAWLEKHVTCPTCRRDVKKDDGRSVSGEVREVASGHLGAGSDYEVSEEVGEVAGGDSGAASDYE
ncbi:hypothetical protein LTR08_007642 [Meristemomyces frigidus]|nr:hypothetical protein LTR08_007642 [Meristemomyces frigidus]